LTSPGRVLIVDGSDECRTVLRTALEHHGAIALEASNYDQAIAAFDAQRPDLVILDADTPGRSATDADEFARFADQAAMPIIILGTLAGANCGNGRSRHCISKPYHFAPLIHRIEQLLQEHHRAAA